MSDTIGELFDLKTPKAWNLKDAPMLGSNPELLMGLELEIEGCTNSADWYTEQTTKLGWVTTIDESLRGVNVGRRGGIIGSNGNAFEFISKPMKQYVALYSLEKFFEVTKFAKANYSDRTSVHVHVNCLDLTREQVSSIAMLYTVVEDILFKFVGENREHNIYCIPWTQCRLNYDIVQRLTADNSGSLAKRWQKYTALNLQPLLTQGTVEFRHMHGTSDMPKLRTWLNIIGSLFNYAGETELTKLIAEIKGLNSSSEYQSFFDKVFSGALPFDDSYRASLEAGVINAKYGLINFGKAKTTKDSPYLQRAIEEEGEDTTFTAPRAGLDFPPPVRNRFNPWPPVGWRTIVGHNYEHLNTHELETLRSNPGQHTLEGSILTVTGQAIATGVPQPGQWGDLRRAQRTARFVQNQATAASTWATTGLDQWIAHPVNTTGER